MAHADRILDAARTWASENHARITPPGAEGGYGRAVDGLEGFARTFLLAGFRILGARGIGVEELIDFYSRGIRAGVDPEAPDRWVRMDEHAQAKVEAASLALILDMTRPWIWDRLETLTQQRVIAYLAPVVGDDTYPKTNWLWFRVVVETFLRSVGGPWSADDIADDLALHDSLVREDGWISDGFERSYDHYVGWALHLYPVLWSRMQGAGELAAGRTSADIGRLDRYLQDAIALVGADGSPLVQGRSLIYRFAAAAPFWVGILAEVPSLSPGALRHAATTIIDHFAGHGVPTADGVLSMGWHDEWRPLAQSYSGPGSPYWAVKGLLGIALPADHPVWAASAEPLPAECRDTLMAVKAAGWIASATVSDGIVRIVNHGTDHAAAGTLVGDSPLYARLGYSTRTSPLLDSPGWRNPLEQSVALVDRSGNATHRAAMELLGATVQGGTADSSDSPVGVASSTWAAHWITPSGDHEGHGSGVKGDVRVAGRLVVHSLVRRQWEVRLVQVVELEPGIHSGDLTLRIGGWALSAATVTHDLGTTTTRIHTAGTHAGLTALSSPTFPGGALRARVETRPGASPLGPVSLVGVLEAPVAVGDWMIVLLDLSNEAAAPTAVAVVTDSPEDLTVTIAWPDSVSTTSRLTHVRSALTAER